MGYSAVTVIAVVALNPRAVPVIVAVPAFLRVTFAVF